MPISQEFLSQFAPHLKLEATEVNNLLASYEITSSNRLAGFFAQCAHESIDFKCKEENLNYSASGLCKVFKKYFPNEESAKPYARNPQKIANKVYANRMGNGDENSGEGYKYRGRGYIQLTGKSNYEGFAKAIGKSLEEAVKYCESEQGALESALYFWNREQCNSLCDKDDITALTKRINGGTNGLEDRKERYEAIKAFLG